MRPLGQQEQRVLMARGGKRRLELESGYWRLVLSGVGTAEVNSFLASEWLRHGTIAENIGYGCPGAHP